MDGPSSQPTRMTHERPVLHRHGAWPAWVFAAVIAVGALANLANPALLARPTANVWDGSWSEAYQRAFDDASPLHAVARTAWGVVDYSVFGQGRRGVVVGSGGWLFTAEEFDVVPDHERAVGAWIDIVRTVAARLAEDDIDLVVALVPSKAAMVTDAAPAPLPQGALARYDAARDGFEGLGVATPDLRPALAAAAEAGDVFLRTDTHWTPHGAESAAGAIARAVRERTRFVPDGTPFVTTVTGTDLVWGDLMRFLDLGPFAQRWGPPPDALEVRHTASLAKASDDLFADVRVPIALVGTSYSADPRWNLAGALREALGDDVLEAAVAGVGPLEPMRRYLASEAFANSPPDVVIWELPERYLTLAGHVPPTGSAPW
jgi:alginate O-acetyltransferase complex protein AlgJ